MVDPHAGTTDASLTLAEAAAARAIAVALVGYDSEIVARGVREARNLLLGRLLVSGMDLPVAVDRTDAFLRLMAAEMARALSGDLH